MAKSISSTKGKIFNFRISQETADAMAEIKLKAAQAGIRVNLSEPLVAALEREIKAVQKHLQTIDPTWAPGQMSLDIDGSVKTVVKTKDKA